VTTSVGARLFFMLALRYSLVRCGLNVVPFSGVSLFWSLQRGKNGGGLAL